MDERRPVDSDDRAVAGAPADPNGPPSGPRAGAADGTANGDGPSAAPREPRPIVERVGLALIALLLAGLFGAVATASWFGGELFLAVMAAVGCLMTAWVGALTLIRS